MRFDAFVVTAMSVLKPGVDVFAVGSVVSFVAT